MKKRILFVLISMNMGGTEKSLLHLMKKNQMEGHYVSVLLLKKEGALLSEIPKGVTVITFNDAALAEAILDGFDVHKMKQHFINRHFAKAFRTAWMTILQKMKLYSLMYVLLTRKIKSLPTVYDEAHAYAGPMYFISWFVQHKTIASNKFQWNHFDVRQLHLHVASFERIFNKFDFVYSVSSEAGASLQEVMPSLKNHKVNVNEINKAEINSLSLQRPVFKSPFQLTLVTTGRLTPEKGADLAIDTLKILKMNNVKAGWIWVGDGVLKPQIMKRIKAEGLEQEFILTGELINPYSIMIQADIYIQPSVHEGFCLTIAEAKALNLPIIAVENNGSRSQLTNKIGERLVSFSSKELAEAVIEHTRCTKELPPYNEFTNVLT
ncbi:glycosyltransferase [Bacillus daqingensis]|uniref:Glycosyltransferase n=1 Tax=Bacillus daqingensis TaxID=872396 RepID=A0ABV9NTP6_9BACI